jgi:hypothetical protein
LLKRPGLREYAEPNMGLEMAKGIVTKAKAGVKSVGREALGAAAKAAAGVVLEAASGAWAKGSGRLNRAHPKQSGR